MFQSLSQNYNIPQLFVFGNIFLSSEELEPISILHKNTWKNEDKKLKQWFHYWEENGNALVRHNWQKKYGEYMQNVEKDRYSDCDSQNKETDLENCSEETTQICTSFDEKVEDLNSPGNLTVDDQWQIIWEENYLEIYNKQFELFETVYCSYCTLYLDDFNICQKKQQSLTPDFVDFEEELQLIRSLGLPLAFGRKNKSLNDEKSRRKIVACETYDLFSDEEYCNEKDLLASGFNEMKVESDESGDKLEEVGDFSGKIKRKNRKNRRLKNIPESILNDKTLIKYWRNRFTLFSRYDEGIRMDRESWFSVTPEKIAIHLAQRLKCNLLIDGFCGSGGNAIQFAMTCGRVIAIDIDSEKISMARHNAKIYGVENKIEFIIGDFLQLSSNLKGDTVFLSPPWGGPQYRKKSSYDIEQFLSPISATELFQKSRQISENIALFLPRNSDMSQVIKLAGRGKSVQVEHNYLDTRLVAITAIYGDQLLLNN